MRKLIMWNIITLDGYFEGNQNWDLTFHNVVWGQELEKLSAEQLHSADYLVFGRVTYEGMAAYWTKEEGEIADLMNRIPKLVFSKTLKLADWNNIIERYNELYRVEQAFRISKHDLQTRPIFHFKEDPINLHILICFMALVVTKHIELTTGDSIRKFLTECKKVTDARMLNKITNKETRIRSKYNEKALEYLKSLKWPH